MWAHESWNRDQSGNHCNGLGDTWWLWTSIGGRMERIGQIYVHSRKDGDVGVWREGGELDFQLRKLGRVGSYS